MNGSGVCHWVSLASYAMIPTWDDHAFRAHKQKWRRRKMPLNTERGQQDGLTTLASTPHQLPGGASGLK